LIARALGYGLAAVATVGVGLLYGAGSRMVARARRRAAARDDRGIAPVPSASILKPLHGAEPRLADNLATALDQRGYHAPAEMVCGVADAGDRALDALAGLKTDGPVALRTVIGGRPKGRNAKVGNLESIAAQASGEMLVLADSDMAVPPDYLASLASALAQPGVGAATCLYVGRGDAGFWSRLVAAGIDTHFLPSVELGLATGRANPCMGSTIALRASTLEQIGGMAAFRDVLADDFEIGVAVRAAGLRVVVPDMVLVHGCADAHARQMLRQELRWNATVAGLDKAGYLGSVVLHPLPLALIGGLLGGGIFAWSVALAALLVRGRIALAACQLDPFGRKATVKLQLLALVPLRDLLSFTTFLGALAVRNVHWRGANMAITAPTSTLKD